jgi:hypothetical protein
MKINSDEYSSSRTIIVIIYAIFAHHLNKISSGSSGFFAFGFNTALTTILSPGFIENEVVSFPI